jgi:hypothetical protein
MQQQLDLFGKSIEKPKPIILPSLPSGCNDKTFEEYKCEIAQKYYGRRHIGFPCDVAQDMPIDDRPCHIETCPDCQELIKKLDAIAYGKI